ncbi:MAG: chemotaxis protein CheD [Christensenellaceae bacterium]|nr:chemotaxis protein CheD [Christensenellaceae bacterium]MEA5064675.1 chemotaxis protein CheD [Eubacteriales bacterium]MEA5068967.1 chemotaxis protein CheD [Christensenellaceae bacterium]
MADIMVGIADMAVARAPHTITTLGLGSCVGIVMYDKVSKIGGLAHVLLPNAASGEANLAKCADTAARELKRRMLREGASPALIVGKLAGGAHMFGMVEQVNVLQIGKRNIEQSLLALRQCAVPVVAQDVGGSVGRTIILNCETGALTVRTIRPPADKNI